MAERRMIAKTIIDSDSFLDTPMSSQCLYFHLLCRADDEGFINNPKKIARMIGAGDDDLRILCAKHFIIPFESGVVVIKHWKIHNYIQKDRFNPTVYEEERAALTVKENGAYTLDTKCIQDVSNLDTKCIQDVSNLDTKCIQDVSNLDTQVSIGKDSIGKGKRERFLPPTVAEVQEYIDQNHYTFSAQAFCDYYESKGWTVGKDSKMKDWKAAARLWQMRERPHGSPRRSADAGYQGSRMSDEELARLEKSLVEEY